MCFTNHPLSSSYGFGVSDWVMDIRRRQRHQALGKQKRGDKLIEEFIAEYERAMVEGRRRIFRRAIEARSVLKMPYADFDDFVEGCLEMEARLSDRWEYVVDDDVANAGVEETADGDVADTNAVADAGQDGRDGGNVTQDVLADLFSANS